MKLLKGALAAGGKPGDVPKFEPPPKQVNWDSTELVRGERISTLVNDHLIRIEPHHRFDQYTAGVWLLGVPKWSTEHKTLAEAKATAIEFAERNKR